ncbi:hypothetical protein [Candidatus Magnetominusculus dajiuhuensis]|uniref:hypothetical protein n=1 Tax=Candidatus Magnetominusculus dajiuhuensis TaxID=3137712 RepID=UPI0019EEC13F|nr:hypothetical protein [Nitrospirota bacterium]
MSKEIAVIVYPGLHYKESISYASKSASETGSALSLIGIIPEFCNSERAAISMYEFGPIHSLTESVERDSIKFFDVVKDYCKGKGITSEFSVYRGSIEDVIDHVRQNNHNVELIVVPTPSKTLTRVVSSGKKQLSPAAQSQECAVVLVLD